MDRLVFLISCLFLATTAIAAENSVNVHVSHSFKPAKAVGLLLSPEGVIEKTGIDVDSAHEGFSILTIPFSSNEISDETKATAMVISEQGEIAFGEIQSLAHPSIASSNAKLPICTDTVSRSAVVDDTIFSNMANLESLLEIRKIRREFIQLELKKKLSGNTLQKLKNMEKGFGFNYDHELSAELPPVELTDRLFRVLTTIKSFESHKGN